MTNKEKFEEVYGFTPNTNRPPCLLLKNEVRWKICEGSSCRVCPFNHLWWDRDYLPCFKMKEFGDG